MAARGTLSAYSTTSSWRSRGNLRKFIGEKKVPCTTVTCIPPRVSWKNQVASWTTSRLRELTQWKRGRQKCGQPAASEPEGSMGSSVQSWKMEGSLQLVVAVSLALKTNFFSSMS